MIMARSFGNYALTSNLARRMLLAQSLVRNAIEHYFIMLLAASPLFETMVRPPFHERARLTQPAAWNFNQSYNV